MKDYCLPSSAHWAHRLNLLDPFVTLSCYTGERACVLFHMCNSECTTCSSLSTQGRGLEKWFYVNAVWHMYVCRDEYNNVTSNNTYCVTLFCHFQLLRCNPKDRLSLDGALSHPWIIANAGHAPAMQLSWTSALHAYIISQLLWTWLLLWGVYNNVTAMSVPKLLCSVRCWAF